ncbi:hypothetical protein [uncultured Ruminococcus sp.]|uniref:hypothetical protein n=1 Tax=uncultured Ruminococcus sp. TaxID=165186 RepID=UPI002586CF99|nr:hypothetical protein [uncultured Ruminococcus sp.]
MENFKKKSFTVLKYIAFGVVIGVLVGAIDTLFGRVLIAITDFRTDYYLFLLPFLPLAGLLITWRVDYNNKCNTKKIDNM